MNGPPCCQPLPLGTQGDGAGARLSPALLSHPAHEDLFSCCQRRNFKGAPYSFFAIHVTAALVLFMTDGMTVSLPSGGAFLGPSTRDSDLGMARAGERHRGFLETSPVVQSIQNFK